MFRASRRFRIGFCEKTEGQDLAEYALIIAVIALGMIPVVAGLRFALSTLYTREANTVQQNVGTPQQPAQAQRPEGVPAGVSGPGSAERVPSEPSEPLNKGLMGTVYWAIQRFVRFVTVVVIITIALLYGSSLREARHIPAGVFRPVKLLAEGVFLPKSESRFTVSSIMRFIAYIVLALAALWIAFR